LVNGKNDLKHENKILFQKLIHVLSSSALNRLIGLFTF